MGSKCCNYYRWAGSKPRWQTIMWFGKRRQQKHHSYMVSAWSNANNMVLAQTKVDDKSNEITAIPKLLDVLMIKGYVITIDAMGCQKEIAGKIIGKEANYILAVKNNQEHLLDDLKEAFCSKSATSNHNTNRNGP